MTFEELGSTLRAEREKRGHSIDNVAAHLKISPRIIRALEEGDESALPHAVYVRGFIRSYGMYLGLDEQELSLAAEEIVDEQEAPMQSVYVAPEAGTSGVHRRIVFTLFLAACLAGLVFFWLYREADMFSDAQQTRLTTAQPAPAGDLAQRDPSGGASGQSPSGQSPAAAPARPAPQGPQGDGGRNATAQPAAGPAAASRESAPAAPAQPAPQGAQQTPPQAAAQAAPGSAQGAAQPSSPARPAEAAATQTRQTSPAGQHKIIITALAECWIHSSADNTDTRQFSLRKGDTFALTFANKLVLKLGNAGGVRIRYNGEDMPTPGKEGQVRTLTFPPTE